MTRINAKSISKIRDWIYCYCGQLLFVFFATVCMLLLYVSFVGARCQAVGRELVQDEFFKQVVIASHEQENFQYEEWEVRCIQDREDVVCKSTRQSIHEIELDVVFRLNLSERKIEDDFKITLNYF